MQVPVGIDHGFSFPLRHFETHRLKAEWPIFLDDFQMNTDGAEVGDLFMSLIHTCELNGANSFHYLTELQRHAPQMATNPADWMPWNYRQTLEPATGP